MTLIEIMIAAGIMLVALVMMFGTLMRISDTTSNTQERAIAATQLASLTDDVQAMTIDQLKSYTAPALTGLGAYQTVQVQCVDKNGTLVDLPSTDTNFDSNMPDPLEVRIRVTWRDESGRTFQQQVSTIVRR